jgi:hypothetical protein
MQMTMPKENGMTVDRYTKAMLTIIAVSLVALVGQNAVTSVRAANDQITRVQICDAQNGRCAAVIEAAGLFGRVNLLAVTK